MFSYSAYDLPGGVAHVLCSTARCCAYDKVYYVFDFAVEELLRVWYVYWEFVFKSCAFCKASGFE